jgi:hypothetical protein
MLRYLYPAFVAAALHTLLLGIYVAAFHGDVSALTCTGSRRAGSFPYEHVTVQPSFGLHGYDGQFYYALAQAPFGRHTLLDDSAAKRQLRLFYPLLCWLLTGGDPVALLWAMPLVNLLAIGGLASLGALVAARQGFSPWWGILLPLAVNAGLAAVRDLTDAVSTLTLAALLLGWLLRWPWWSLALCGGAALFSREQNAAWIAVVFFCALGRRQWLACAGLGTAVVLWGAWVEWLQLRYHESPFLSSRGHLDVPFSGWYYACLHPGHDYGHVLRTFFCLALLVFQSVLALDLLRRREVDPALRLAALVALGLALVGGEAIYEDIWSFSRVYAALPLTVWLGCVQSRRLWPLPLLAAYLLIQWAVVANEVVRSRISG